MHKILEKWIEKNRYKLEEIGITTDEIITTSEEVELPCIRVDQSTDKCIGRICVWKDGTIDLEVLDIQTERRFSIPIKFGTCWVFFLPKIHNHENVIH